MVKVLAALSDDWNAVFNTPFRIPKPLASPAPQYLKLSVWIPQVPAMHAEDRHT